MIDFSALPVFTAVVTYGSFSKAADHLGLSKSAVSKRITAMEHKLGVKLLHRSTRHLNLTEAGALYYRHALDAVTSATRAETLATSLQETPSGILKVSAPWSFGRLQLSKVIPKFLKTYPEIDLRITLSDTLSNPMTEGLDVALHPGGMKDSNLIARKLVRLHSALCASPTYLEQNGIPQSPADLLNHNCILSTHASSRGEWVFINDEERVKIKVQGNYQVNNSEALREAVTQDIGIGRLPTYVAGEDLFSGKLIAVLPRFELPYKDLYAVYPHQQYLPPKVRVFIDFLICETANGQQIWDRWKTNLTQK